MILGMGATTAAASLTAAGAAAQNHPAGPAPVKPSSHLVVQPVLTYEIYRRREKTSWRPWGGLHDQAQVNQEVERINTELENLASRNTNLRFLPAAPVSTVEQARKVAESAADLVLIYAATGAQRVVETLIDPERPPLFFLRHNSGPISLWYEILHPRLLRKTTDSYAVPHVDVQDVVVDDETDLEWRLRALLGLRRTTGQPIVAIGGPDGWGSMGPMGPRMAREKWRLDIRTVDYPDLARRIEKLRADPAAVSRAAKEAADYLKQPNLRLHTDMKYVENAFLLNRVFLDVMEEHSARAMTVNQCMGTIMPIADTTACLPLTLLNDEGYLAFCESDFIVIPIGFLMHHITGTPVFLNDPTWPHHGKVTVAHCTAPRKMDGRNCDPAGIFTHFESDFGAAPKVEMRKGQVVTMVAPDFSFRKYVGFRGTVESNPFHDICRSQSDIAIEGDWERLLQDMRGFHWMMVYGDCRKETGFALKRLGIEWEDISA
jgi:L-fucose isomerase-like protein